VGKTWKQMNRATKTSFLLNEVKQAWFASNRLCVEKGPLGKRVWGKDVDWPGWATLWENRSFKRSSTHFEKEVKS